MGRKRLWALRVLALAGLALSARLSALHIEYSVGLDAGEGVCAAHSAFDCAAIEASRYSEFFGVSTASWGALFFIVFLAALFLMRPEAKGAEAESDGLRVATGLSAIGLAACLAFASISAFVVRAICPWCAGVYAVSFAMAALLMKGGPIAYARRAMGSPLAAWRVIRSRNEPAMSRGGLGFARATVLALAAAAVFANFTLPAKLRRDAIDAEPLIQDYMRRPRARFDVSPGSLVKGPPDAPIEIVVFTDFECPYCRHFHGRLDRILEKFPGQYRLIYKHYPVSDICNPIFQGSPARAQHPRACRMAQLAQAMGEMGKFWDASADLYGAQGIFNLNMVAEEIARRAGVELGEWAALAESPAIRAAVEADIREGNRLRLVETPAMWINGRRASPARDDIIERMLRIALMEGR